MKIESSVTMTLTHREAASLYSALGKFSDHDYTSKGNTKESAKDCCNVYSLLDEIFGEEH